MLHLTEVLQTRAANLCQSINTFLMDQSRVVKSGNIYALESLFLARISPVRPAKSLQSDEVDCLHPAIRATLLSALGRNLRATELGPPFLLFPQWKSEPCRIAREFKIDRDPDLPGLSCGILLQKRAQLGRQIFFCPACQG
jgi:formamidopyrimidine-DNA glycosylase